MVCSWHSVPSTIILRFTFSIPGLLDISSCLTQKQNSTCSKLIGCQHIPMPTIAHVFFPWMSVYVGSGIRVQEITFTQQGLYPLSHHSSPISLILNKHQRLFMLPMTSFYSESPNHYCIFFLSYAVACYVSVLFPQPSHENAASYSGLLALFCFWESISLGSPF